MGYQVYEDRAARDLGVERWAGYAVPAICDHPGCEASIDRGMGYRCGRCELSFCSAHLWFAPGDGEPQMCERCCNDEDPFEPKPDVARWERWILADESWAVWRAENPARVRAMRERVPMPIRVQQRRTKGWRKPENTVSVARPSRWGNPFRVGDEHSTITRGALGESVYTQRTITPAVAVELYRQAIADGDIELPDVEEIRTQLGGKNLMCFCHPDQPCHVDVLLEIANGTPT